MDTTQANKGHRKARKKAATPLHPKQSPEEAERLLRLFFERHEHDLQFWAIDLHAAAEKIIASIPAPDRKSRAQGKPEQLDRADAVEIRNWTGRLPDLIERGEIETALHNAYRVGLAVGRINSRPMGELAEKGMEGHHIINRRLLKVTPQEKTFLQVMDGRPSAPVRDVFLALWPDTHDFFWGKTAQDRLHKAKSRLDTLLAEVGCGLTIRGETVEWEPAPEY